jgi:poly(3-hydroxybutyrate) depolymerase
MVTTPRAVPAFAFISLGALVLGCASDSTDMDKAVQAETSVPSGTTAPAASPETPSSGSMSTATMATSPPTMASTLATPSNPSNTAPPSGSIAPSGVGTPGTQVPITPAMSSDSGEAPTSSGGSANTNTGGAGGETGEETGGAPASSTTLGSGGDGGAAVGAGGNSEGEGGSGAGGSDVGGNETQSGGCGMSRTLMNGRKTIQSGGMNREYILRVPDDYDSSHPYRLVMAYHWLSGNADQVANGGGGGSTDDPYYGLWDLADNSTIFVAPEGLDAGWANTGDRDLALTDAILAELQNDLCIDTTRIFATGFSYGAGMSYAIACARADVFRGVALYAGAQLSGCNGGTTPIAYFHAHGVADSVLDISQGHQLRDHFVEVNGCTPQTPAEPAKNSGSHTCTSYEGCSDGHPLRWCAHGGDHNPTEKDQGQNKSWVPGEAWAFISQF